MHSEGQTGRGHAERGLAGGARHRLIDGRNGGFERLLTFRAAKGHHRSNSFGAKGSAGRRKPAGEQGGQAQEEGEGQAQDRTIKHVAHGLISLS